MPIRSRIASTLRSLARRPAVEQDLDAELRACLDLREQELVALGMGADEAQRTARLEFGGLEQIKERVRDTRRGALVDSVAQDLRFGARALRRNPVFTAVAVATLAIAIGGTTAVLSTIDAALVRPVAYDESDRLVAGTKTFNGAGSGPVSRLDYFDFRERSRSFGALGAYAPSSLVAVTGGTEPWMAAVGAVSWNLFRALRVDPILGRHFTPDEEQQDRNSTAIISYGLWQARFAGSPAVVGTAIVLGGTPVTIVGVMPRDFRFMTDADVWVAINQAGPWDPVRDSHSHWIVGRLKPGVSLAQAQHDVDAIAGALAADYPATNAGKGLRLTTLQAFMVRNIRAVLILLMAAMLGVLAIACTNVAGLLLARGQRRLPEIAMRAALGASRQRLVRQLVTETLLLTFLAGAIGVWIATLALSWLEPLLSLGAEGIGRPPMDARTLLVAVATSLATGLAVGIVPALRATGGGPARWLGTGRLLGERRHGVRLRGTFVVAQVALSVVLLAASALIIGNIVRLTPGDLGFNPDGVFTARVMLAPARYAEPARRQEFCESVLADIAKLPGVRWVGAVSKLPVANPWQDWGIWPAGRRPAAPAERLSAMARWVMPGYFGAMGIPLRAGRDISPRDVAGAPQVIVLSERTAERLFPDQDAIGRMVEVWSTTGTFEVVGVVGDARLNIILDDPAPAMYMSSAQAGSIASRIVVRTSGDPGGLAGPIREIVRRLDRDVPLVDLAPMTAIVDEGLSVFRVVGLALGIYAGIAMLLTAIGLYGALAFHVSQQEGEMSIRLAMGATPTGLLCRVLRRGLALAGGGVLIGATLAVPATRLLDQLPFTLQPQGPSGHAMVLAVLAAVAFAACAGPAWRVTRINPVDALRKG